MSDGYTTPEGHWLAKPLLLPEVRTFAELFEQSAPWPRGMNVNSPIEPRRLIADGAGARTLHAILDIGREIGVEWREQGDPRDRGNEIGPYCSFKRVTRDHRQHRGQSLAVRCTDAVMDAIAPRIVTPDDHLSFEIIEHADRGRALVIAQHGQIIGGHWLAYINPETVPFQD